MVRIVFLLVFLNLCKILMQATEATCSCSEFVSEFGYGNCGKVNQGKPMCYVNTPSNCTDLKESQSVPNQYYSYDACDECGRIGLYFCKQEKCINKSSPCGKSCHGQREYSEEKEACMGNCSCSQYVNKHGFGKCLKQDKNGVLRCYVHLPSNCSDLRASQTNPDKFTSFEACDRCKQPGQYFCLDENKCIDLSDTCNEYCLKDRWYCKETNKCISLDSPCEKSCNSDRSYCDESGKCMSRTTPCGIKCLHPDYPFICDNFTFCLNNLYVNNDRYECADRTDEHDQNYPDNQVDFANEATINQLIQIYQNHSFTRKDNETTRNPDHPELQTDSDAFQGAPGCEMLWQNFDFGEDFIDWTKSSSLKECQELCLLNNGCAGLTWVPATERNCALYSKEGIAEGVPHKGQHSYNCSSNFSPPYSNPSWRVIHEKSGSPGLECGNGSVVRYIDWCREYSFIKCGEVPSTDYLICRNGTFWSNLETDSCGTSPIETGSQLWSRGCKELAGRCVLDKRICDGVVGDRWECGKDDYSDEVCRVTDRNTEGVSDLWRDPATNKFDASLSKRFKKERSEFQRYFMCSDEKARIHPVLVCNGHFDCEDGSDEDECNKCPRRNKMVIHDQVIKLKEAEIKEMKHLKHGAIHKCNHIFSGLPVCATPGDGVPECQGHWDDSGWQSGEETKSESFLVWYGQVFGFIACVFGVAALLVLAHHGVYKVFSRFYLKRTNMESTVELCTYPSLPGDDIFFPLLDEDHLTNDFKDRYIENHGNETFFNFTCFLVKMMDNPEEAKLFCSLIYALEVQIHNLSATATDNCLKRYSGSQLMKIYDSAYGSIGDKILPKKAKDLLHQTSKNSFVQKVQRIISFIKTSFFFYYDLAQEFFLLVSITSGIPLVYWISPEFFDSEHFIVLSFLISVFLPIYLFSVHLAYSSNLGLVLGFQDMSLHAKAFYKTCCFLISPLVPMILFFKVDQKEKEILDHEFNAFEALKSRHSDPETNIIVNETLKRSFQRIEELSREIKTIRSIYRQFKFWELAIELPTQAALTTIFSLVTMSSTVVTKVFTNRFVNQSWTLFFIILLSMRSIISVQLLGESARRNNYMGLKSKVLMSILYILSSLSRIWAIVVFLSVPLGLFSLHGHFLIEKAGINYWNTGYNPIDEYKLKKCTRSVSNEIHRIPNTFLLNSSLFNTEVLLTEYTIFTLSQYAWILIGILSVTVIINFIFLVSKGKYSLLEKLLHSVKSIIAIDIFKDFDENDYEGEPDDVQTEYMNRSRRVKIEYLIRLLMHTVTNMVLTFPWSLAYSPVQKRHNILYKLGNCYGVKGTVPLEDLSFSRLRLGQWLLPLSMALIGLVNLGAFFLYMKLGHPWRSLLLSDHEKRKVWRSLQFWDKLQRDCKCKVLQLDFQHNGIQIQACHMNIVFREEVKEKAKDVQGELPTFYETQNQEVSRVL